MSGRHTGWLHRLGWLRGVAVAVGFSAIVIVLLLWLAGWFEPKIPTEPIASAAGAAPAPRDLVAVREASVPHIETAAGTISPVHETKVASKLLARVTHANLLAGQQVEEGEVLVRLADTDIRARLQQAQAALSAAQATRDQATRDEKRVAEMFRSQAASEDEYDSAVTQVKLAEAEVLRAQEMINEARAILDYTVIRAPMTATVIDKHVDVGDTVGPGEILVTLYDPRQMQLVASVRESLANRMKVGQPIQVRVDVLNRTFDGRVSEIVPEAQSASRTFQVKVTTDYPTDVYSGMFGRLIIPLDDQQVVVVPRRAIQHVGQLELVNVVEDGLLRRRAVRLGRVLGDDVEVLSGLRPGEQVALPPAQGV